MVVYIGLTPTGTPHRRRRSGRRWWPTTSGTTPRSSPTRYSTRYAGQRSAVCTMLCHLLNIQPRPLSFSFSDRRQVLWKGGPALREAPAPLRGGAPRPLPPPTSTSSTSSTVSATRPGPYSHISHISISRGTGGRNKCNRPTGPRRPDVPALRPLVRAHPGSRRPGGPARLGDRCPTARQPLAVPPPPPPRRPGVCGPCPHRPGRRSCRPPRCVRRTTRPHFLSDLRPAGLMYALYEKPQRPRPPPRPRRGRGRGRRWWRRWRSPSRTGHSGSCTAASGSTAPSA